MRTQPVATGFEDGEWEPQAEVCGCPPGTGKRKQTNPPL